MASTTLVVSSPDFGSTTSLIVSLLVIWSDRISTVLIKAGSLFEVLIYSVFLCAVSAAIAIFCARSNVKLGSASNPR
ncbi:hypothetical protein T02_4768 [Trichinella nativa]|uniref:Uncharacterized protein n=1 Tax=Trichinella nativa TaxID=6335 RepID=A0A0V1L692_9BILA|nr:hypothetical protein T02_4768 [Trichinella nativa]